MFDGNPQTNSVSVVILVDEDLDHDRRVLASLEEYLNIQVIDCRSLHGVTGRMPPRAFVKAFHALIVALIGGFSLWKQLRQIYGLKFDSFEKGIRSSWNSFLRAHRVADELRLQTKGVGLIHAHDLYCGVIGAELARSSGARLIYDAHEVEFHRNRTNSWLRFAFDWAIEKRVIESAHEVRVVNAPIAELYRSVYQDVDGRLRVVLNDHFPVHPIQAGNSPASGSAKIVYIGGGTEGRQLEQLALAAADLRFPVHAFFMGEIPASALEAGWAIGGKDYEDELVALAASQRCMMWCCVEHVCLSYRLALPNKFFQALAVGLPVIASEGTYLSSLIRAHDIGDIFDGKNLSRIRSAIMGKRYETWVKNVIRVRQQIRAGQLII